MNTTAMIRGNQTMSNFKTALDNYKRVIEHFGSEHPDAMLVFALAAVLAPDEFIENLLETRRTIAKKPSPFAYTAEGEPLYSLDGIARDLGLTMKQVIEATENLNQRLIDAGLPAIAGAVPDGSTLVQ